MTPRLPLEDTSALGRPQRVLLVDDEPPVLSALVRALRPLRAPGLQVEACADPVRAVARLQDTAFDVIVSDYRMPGMSGLDFLARAADLQPQAVRMILSASTDAEVIVAAVNRVGLHRYLLKPWDDAAWRQEVRGALDLACERAQERVLADAMRGQRGEISPQELERRRLEAIEPGITRVAWGPRGEVLMPDLGLAP